MKSFKAKAAFIKIEQEFLNAIKSVCEKFGILLIIDEIQTGIGRTGKPFAFQHYQVDPDIITIAKGLGNGLPIGAMVGKKELAEYLDQVAMDRRLAEIQSVSQQRKRRLKKFSQKIFL